MKSKSILLLMAGMFIFLICGPVFADEVWLKNGDRITGKVLSLEGGIILVNTTYAGDMPIKWEEIANLKTEEPIKVVLSDETLVQGPVLPGEGGKILVQSEKFAAPVMMELSDVTVINPKPALSTTVRANLGASFASGNTDREDLYLDGEFMARTVDNRYTIGGLYRSAKSEDVRTEDKTLGYMKYDHFFTEKWYGYANTSAEKDKFKDLDLRYDLGLGAGYQFIESELTNLSFEGGLSYVNENYNTDENSFTAGRWSLRFDHFLLPDALQLFLIHTGLQSLEDTEDLVLFNQAGFRVPFYNNLNFTGQMNWDYDKSPAPGKDKNDYAYIFSIGYLLAK